MAECHGGWIDGGWVNGFFIDLHKLHNMEPRLKLRDKLKERLERMLKAKET